MIRCFLELIWTDISMIIHVMLLSRKESLKPSHHVMIFVHCSSDSLSNSLLIHHEYDTTTGQSCNDVISGPRVKNV